MVSETELAQAYAAAGWYAYPSDKPETSGIALMKAQACGAVPITSGQLASALPETVGGWDLEPLTLTLTPTLSLTVTLTLIPTLS